MSATGVVALVASGIALFGYGMVRESETAGRRMLGLVLLVAGVSGSLTAAIVGLL